MGNQGTNNWKLSVFFIVSLTLIAGLFSNVAMAARGDGTVTYELQDIGTTENPHAFVPVGNKSFELTFIYTLQATDRDEMAEGGFKVQIPTSEGWTVTDKALFPVPRAMVTTSGTQGDIPPNPAPLVAGTALIAAFTSGYTEAQIYLPNDPDSNAANTLPLAVQISFRVDAPSKRDMDINKFTVSSRVKDGSFLELKSETAKDTDADPATKSGVRIRVGAKDTLILNTPINPDKYVDAGQTGQMVSFTYAVPSTEMNDMEDGHLEISLPPGWTFVSDRTDFNPSLILTTGNRMSISGTMATVRWDGSAPTNLTIDFVVNVPLGRTLYTFPTKSKTNFPDDSFTTLDTATASRPAQPVVNVGNIADGEGTVTVSPGDLYHENPYNRFVITFTAKGPMYSDSDEIITTLERQKAHILIQFPFDAFGFHSVMQVTNLTISRGTRVISTTTTYPGVVGALQTPDADDSLLIKVDGLSSGQSVVVTGDISSLTSTAVPMTKVAGPSSTVVDRYTSSFRVFTSTGALNNDVIEWTRAEISAGVRTGSELGRSTLKESSIGTVQTSPLELNADADIDVTGGKVRAKAGSGTLTVTINGAETVEKGTKEATLKLEYETAASLIDLEGGVEFSLDPNLSGIDKANVSISGVTATLDPSQLPAGKIAWTAFTPVGLGKSFSVTITKVNIPNSTADLSFTSTVGSDTDGTLVDESVGPADKVAVVGKVEDVDFDMVDANGNPISNPSYHAASKQEIRFRFTARNTTIGKGGYIKVLLPSLWARATTGNAPAQVAVDTTLTSKDVIDNKLRKSPVSAGGQTITLYTYNAEKEKGLAKGDSVTVRFGIKHSDTKDYRIEMPNLAGDIEAMGSFKAGTGFTTEKSEYTVRTIKVTISNVADGSGTATISPRSVEAGSTDNKITVRFSAVGSMGGGAVSLQIPAGWGEMQHESSTLPNYITVSSNVKGVEGNYDDLDDADGDSIVVAALPDDFNSGNQVTFTYGGDPGTNETNAVAQDSVADYASFKIKSDGSGDGSFGDLTSTTAAPTGTDGLGQIYKDANGQLRVQVKSATAGVGTVAVAVAGSKGGEQLYIVDGAPSTMHRVHAGDDEAYLTFTYNPEQDIAKGKLELTIPSEWSQPQNDTTGRHGYLSAESTGDIGLPAFVHSGSGSTVTVGITDLDAEEDIVIHYGRGSNGAEAPDAVGPSSFSMRVSGGEVSAGVSAPFIRIKSQLTIDIWSQRSGEGAAEVAVSDDDGDLHAGDEDREVEITYTSIGQIRGGQVKLTVPANWSPATTADEGDNVQIAPGSAHDGTPTFTAGAPQEITAEGVNLSAGGTLTFIYTTDVQPAAQDDVAFTIAVNGGEGPGEDLAAIAVQPVIDVRAARIGTGKIAVAPGHVEAGSEDNDLVFTYTAVGDIFFPTEFTVTVPQGWTSATAGTRTADEGRYTVAHMRGTTSIGGVEKLRPENGNMMARVKRSGRIQSGDNIVFSYFNATAPSVPEPSEFQMMFGAEAIEAGPFEILVQPASGATQIAILDVADLSSDEAVQTPVMVTVQLQGDDGSPAATEAELVITLSSDSTTGMFAAPAADGTMPAADAVYTATLDITIAAAMWEGMAYYMDSTLGTHELTVMPDATSALDAAPGSVNVRTDNPEIMSVDFDIADSAGTAKTGTLATTGDVVTVTAVADPNEALTFAIGTALTVRDLDESTATPGTYTGSWTVVEDLNDGMHSVTATLGGPPVAADNQLTIDTTAPMVSVTAPAAGMVVANGATVTITVTVTDDTDVSVEADVSGLDLTQTDMVGLTAGTGDSYGVDIEISTDNTEAKNGMKTITVTATDAAGISGEGSVMVQLRNAVSFTSMIPDGISLFHVPLDVEGLDTVANLRAALGDNVIQIIAHRGGSDYDADSGDVAITADLGLIVVTNGGVEHKFVGEPWGSGTAMINVSTDGNNLIGVPVDSGDMMISDIIDLFPEGVVAAIITAAGDNKYPRIDGPDDPDDAAVKGDAAYLTVVTGDGTATVSGAGWSNGGSASAAPIALSGYQLDTQTPVVSVYGSVVDEITGLAKEGFRAKVKNLTTKAALSSIISVEATDGFNMTFVDLTDAHAARVGDVLEISADSPDPLVGVKPVRHIVTVDDVKNSRIQLEDLIAYEIPAETELLRNYPNPFNPETWIPYHLSEDADVNLTIYGINGEVVRDIDVGHQTAAKYDTRAKAIYWDGRNRFGEQVASGIYFYHLDAGDFSGTRKMVILK